jgi:hypothetical protein
MIEWAIRAGFAIAGVIVGCGLTLWIESRNMPW